MTARWVDPLTPERAAILADWRQAAAETAGFPDYQTFMDHVEEERTRVLDPTRFDQPPPEHTTRDPWPEGFAVPAAVAKLKATADAGWEVRIGYARGSKKLGRGNVGTGADARWALHHFVRLDARPVGTPVRSCVSVTYGAEVGEKLSWKFDGGQLWDDPAANVTKVRAALLGAPPEELMERIATLSATRQTVAPTTDIFASC